MDVRDRFTSLREEQLGVHPAAIRSRLPGRDEFVERGQLGVAADVEVGGHGRELRR
jgi:hypothetical protein